MAAGLALQAIALAWIAAVLSPTTPYIAFVAPFALAGAGMALVFAPAANAVLSSVRPHEAGQASGATNAMREIGGVFGIAVLATIFSNFGGYASGSSFVSGVQPAAIVAAAVLVIGAGAALFVPKLRTVDRRTESGESTASTLAEVPVAA
jgi:MFS family permease